VVQAQYSSTEVAQLRAEIDHLKPELYHALGQIKSLQAELKKCICPTKCAEIVAVAVQHAREELRFDFFSELQSLREELAALAKSGVPVSNPFQDAPPVIITDEPDKETLSTLPDLLELASSSTSSPAPIVLTASQIPLPPSPSMPGILRLLDESSSESPSPAIQHATPSPSASPRTSNFFGQKSPLAPRQSTPQLKPTKAKILLGNPFSKTPTSVHSKTAAVVGLPSTMAATPAPVHKTMYGTERDDTVDQSIPTASQWNMWPAWKASA